MLKLGMLDTFISDNYQVHMFQIRIANVIISISLVLICIGALFYLLLYDREITKFLIWLTAMVPAMSLMIGAVDALNDAIKERGVITITTRTYVERLKKNFKREIEARRTELDENKKLFMLDLPIIMDGKVCGIKEVVYELINPNIHTKLALLGSPGSGKSIVLRQIGIELAEMYLNNECKYMPIFIDLSDKNNHRNPRRLIEQWWRKTSLDQSYKDLIRNRQILFLLDGLNEMPDRRREGSLKSRLKALRFFLEREYEGPFVVACRTADYETYDADMQIGASEIHITELSAQTIRQMSDAMLGPSSDTFLERVCEQSIHRQARIALARNVQSLYMMIRVFERGNNNLPNTSQELYSWYIEELYNVTKRQKEVQTSLDQLTTGLSKLAVDMMWRGVTNVERSWAERRYKHEILRAIPLKQKQLISDCLKIGLLVEESDNSQDSTPGTENKKGSKTETKVKFRHQTLYEYFALPFVKLETGDEWETRIISKLGTLGTFATAKLPEMTHRYILLTKDIYIKNCYRTAIINIALSHNRNESATFVLLILLEAFIQIRRQTKFLYNDEFENPPFEQIRVLKKEFENSTNRTKSKTNIIDIFLRKRNEIVTFQQNSLKEIDVFVAELLNKPSAPRLRAIFEEAKHHSDRGYSDFLEQSNLPEFGNVQNYLESLLVKSKNNKSNLEKLIIAFYEFYLLMEGKDDNLTEVQLQSIVQQQLNFQKQIYKLAQHISDHQ